MRRWTSRAGGIGVGLALAAGLLASVVVPSAAGAAAPTAFVRVDQGGYPAAAAKRAYLMARREETGAPFQLLRSPGGAIAFSGTVGASAGSWSKRFPHVYALDFDGLTEAGTYTLAVGGRAPASSPPFTIAAPASLYAQPLANSLSFYENERDGPEYIPSALRSAPAHLNDAHARVYATPAVNRDGAFKGGLSPTGETIDAAGGWFDAGDYLKFVQTTSYTVALQLLGVRDFPAQMGASAGSASDFTAEARFGVEWLLRMWDDSTRTLYYQVGIGEGNSRTLGDHDLWRLPQADDSYGGTDPAARYIRERPVFRAGPPGAPVSPNLAGRDAAAFALCFQVFRAGDPALAARCLTAAEHIYDAADTEPHGDLLTAIPFDFYPETEWRDDLELGASELATALADGGAPAGLPHTQPSYYLQQAAGWAHAYVQHSGEGEALNLYDVSGLAHFELVRALRRQGSPAGLAISEAQLIAALGGELEAAQAQAAQDPFGFGFPWDEADTASHGDGLSVMASEYDFLTGSSAYGADVVRWLGNVLGANAWGVSLIVGDGSAFPDCPSHQVANLAGSLDGSAPVLAGAVVEGPSDKKSKGKLKGMRRCPAQGGDPYARFNSAAVFKDEVQSYTTVEPAIDLTASSPLAFAWQIAAPRPLGG
ncbi:MAG TPA: glycoside hydrolase family 9 protein [Solirubrobacteraceae bacterium]|nr:glycoside hydrolase family 9 protein [Solirubrobacteraceae bacterium]